MTLIVWAPGTSDAQKRRRLLEGIEKAEAEIPDLEDAYERLKKVADRHREKSDAAFRLLWDKQERLLNYRRELARLVAVTEPEGQTA